MKLKLFVSLLLVTVRVGRGTEALQVVPLAIPCAAQFDGTFARLPGHAYLEASYEWVIDLKKTVVTELPAIVE